MRIITLILTRRLPGASFEQWTFEFLYKTLIHWATSLHPFLHFPNYICHFKMALYMRSKFITISYGNLCYHHMKIKKPIVNFIIKNIFDRKWIQDTHRVSYIHFLSWQNALQTLFSCDNIHFRNNHTPTFFVLYVYRNKK